MLLLFDHQSHILQNFGSQVPKSAVKMPKCCWPIKLQESLKWSISIKKWMVRFIFGMQKFDLFYKLILSFWVNITRRAQSTQNKKFGDVVDFLPADKFESFLQVNSITLGVHSQACPNYQKHQVWITSQYLNKNVKDKADFSLADKRQRFLQINTISLQYLKKKGVRKLIFCMQMSMKVCCKLTLWIWLRWSSIPKVTKKATLQCHYNISDEVDFFHAAKHKIVFQVDFNTFGIKVSYRMMLSLLVGVFKHSQSTQSNKFEISLQYVKKVGMDFIFCMQINIKFDIILFHESGQTCSKYPKFQLHFP